jgi:hypothetical protein
LEDQKNFIENILKELFENKIEYEIEEKKKLDFYFENFSKCEKDEINEIFKFLTNLKNKYNLI